MPNDPIAGRFVQLSDSDFNQISWHDCHIWGISFRVGEPSEGDWTSELLLDIDFICEWCCENEEGRFRVAPATLVFHGVASLAIAIRYAESTLAYPLPIAEISRLATNPHKPASSEQDYRWCISLASPSEGEITFTALGFKQALKAAPVLIDEQCLRLDAREKLLGR
ncbi:MAG TPA: hypothetical protein VG826_09770 [Pirellulales bacterium]|nr:hypothetical protein [Pirellulales bacterium]